MIQDHEIAQHHAVKHPGELIEELMKCQRSIPRWNDRGIDWLTDHILASQVMFDVAFILPLLVLPMPDWTKLILAVISSNWIQWWALPALQRSQNKTQVRQNAKAEVDHRALTHIANEVDKIYEKLIKDGVSK